MNMATKKDVFKEKLGAYAAANRSGKGAILDAVCLVSALTRKAAIRRFRKLQTAVRYSGDRRGRPRTYTNDVIAALRDVWEIGSEACGENLHPMIGEYIDGAVNDRSWRHGAVATALLRSMSAGSVKRSVGAFSRSRRSFGGRGTTKKSPALSMVPIRMDGWDEAETGVLQVDTVAHCGDTVAGDFVYTVNAVDVATLWCARKAQWNKGQEATLVSLAAMREETPFPWVELHPDSGLEFVNAQCVRYAADTGLRMTRSRPYKKNDNCFVEERNGHVVRAYVGYARLDAFETVDALNGLYAALSPFLNHFIASRRIVSKHREGARWKVSREKVAKTPYQRVLERKDVSDNVKARLCEEHARLNPVQLKRDIDRLTARVFAVQKRYGAR